MMEWFYLVCDEMEAWMAHSREAIYDVDLDAPLPTLDKTENFTTKRGKIYDSLPNERNLIFISQVPEPKSVTLLRTGEQIEYQFQRASLLVEVPANLQS